MTSIPSTLHAAYAVTDYRVFAADAPFTLHIGAASAELAQLHGKHAVSCSAFLTAWNPFSHPVDADANHLAQQSLLRDLRDSGVRFIEGMGCDPSGAYAGEESVLALGLARADAIALGRKYQQNAIVWCGQDAVPELILLR